LTSVTIGNSVTGIGSQAFESCISLTMRAFSNPGIAMICFLIALGGSGWLVLGILWKDYKDKHKRKE
jgi:hypothetical protein